MLQHPKYLTLSLGCCNMTFTVMSKKSQFTLSPAPRIEEEDQLEKLLQELKQKYKNQLDDKLMNRPLWKDEYQEYSSGFISVANKYFDQRTTNFSKVLKEKFLKNFLHEVNILMENFKTENHKRVKLHECFEDGITAYRDGMNQVFDDGPRKAKLETRHERIKRERLKAFSSLEDKPRPTLEHERLRKRFKDDIKANHALFLSKCQELSEKDARDFKEDAKRRHKDLMTKLCGEGYISVEKLEDEHNKFLKELEVQAGNDYPSHDEITDNFINKLSDSLNVELGKKREENEEKFAKKVKSVGKSVLIGGLIFGVAGAVAAPLGVLALATEAGVGAVAAATGIGAAGATGLGAVVSGIWAWRH